MAFYGKTALITGGASGLGRLHAIHLAEGGAKVAILDVNEKGMEETIAFSPNIIPFTCDVTNLKQVQEIVDTIEKEIGKIERLIHCAAIMPGGLLMDAEAESINNVMFINYGGMINVCQTVVPRMLARNRGDVILYGSTAGLVPVSRFGAYGASKAATNLYARVLMRENKKSSVRFQLVCPPAVDTPLIDQAKENGPRFLKEAQKTHRNIISPETVVHSVEKCLEKGKKINYPGQAKWINLLHGIFPSLLDNMAQRR
jgi:NAD(P)-dependent dehydrogenase (short-subunit alcohol dehydrogenase family)